MYPRRMKITGVIMIAVSMGILAFGVFRLSEENKLIQNAVPYNGNITGTLKIGDLVVIEGKVSAKNKILIHDFVDAAREYKGNKGSWTISETFRQPVVVDLVAGDITLHSENICSEGTGNLIKSTDEKTSDGREIRYIGLRRGDPVTAVGTLTSLKPFMLEVKGWYSGSAVEYSSFINSSMTGLYVFCILLALIGAGLFLWGMKKVIQPAP